MAIVAKMLATQVTGVGGSRYAACASDDPDGQPIEEAPGVASYYGIPPWLASATHVKMQNNVQVQESIDLSAVSVKGEDDPNREWASATPSGTLTMAIQNPDAWGYIVPGAQYRVTIERIRGPRS